MKTKRILIPLLALLPAIVGTTSSQAPPQSGRAERERQGPRLDSGPDCSGGWPTMMAFVLLKNAGVTDNSKVDFSKSKTTRVASEQIAPGLWRQVYDVTFTEKSGEKIEAIAVSDASSEECSMSGVKLFVVSRRLSSVTKNEQIK